VGKRNGRARRRAGLDLALIVGRTDDHEGVHVLRKRANRPLEMGTLRPLREGKPIQGDVLTLRPRPELPLLCDVTVELTAPRATSDGPPQVATEEYRRGWEVIWGKATGQSPSRAN
jgi:hypothetical protein